MADDPLLAVAERVESRLQNIEKAMRRRTAVLAVAGLVVAGSVGVAVNTASIQRADALCRQQNRSNAGTLALLNALLDLGQKRDSTLPPEQAAAVVKGRAESKALGAMMLRPVAC